MDSVNYLQPPSCLDREGRAVRTGGYGVAMQTAELFDSGELATFLREEPD